MAALRKVGIGKRAVCIKLVNRGLLLNLGCGDRTHSAWVNIDYSRAAKIKAWLVVRRWVRSPLPSNYLNHDLRKGIPFADGAAEVTYSSHVLEHLPRELGLGFCREQWRVLRLGGIIRVVVPDLEGLAFEYLNSIQAARQGGDEAALRHEWSVIRLIDQLVRTKPGGQMQSWLKEHRELSFVRELSGIFAEISSARTGETRSCWLRPIRDWMLQVRNPAQSGELHRWMYDEFSLGRLLAQAGFSHISKVDAGLSQIAGWSQYFLDRSPDGEIHQPGSLYMEATR